MCPDISGFSFLRNCLVTHSVYVLHVAAEEVCRTGSDPR